MAANKLTIKLTPDQQKQIKDATGQNIAEFILEPATGNQLSDQDLDGVAGGLTYNFSLVAVKTISWSGSDGDA